jgi:L-threonylcarbamoyladenylate synthase
MQAVIRQCGFPLAAPSANLSNQVSPTNAEHVSQQLGGRIELIVDGGQAQVGIESTVVDLTMHPPRILRPGMIHEESLLAVTGELTASTAEGGGTLRSPGQLRQHYAPRAKLLVLSWADEESLCRQLADAQVEASTTHVIAHSHVPMSGGLARVSVIPHDVEAFARALYAEWHACDEAGAQHIVVEAPPDGPEWRGVWDRLRRAAA